MNESITLPNGFRFLQAGWFVLHVLAISFFTLVGYVAGARRSTYRTEVGGVQIPATYRFLNGGWWIMHVIAVPLWFILGHIFWPG
ncbi:MAG: hypothetical protein ACYC2Y_00190 [Armatimonadota bacterium]